jgi:hypothetical protein
MRKGLMSLVCVVLIMVCCIANSFGGFIDNPAIKYLEKPVPANSKYVNGMYIHNGTMLMVYENTKIVAAAILLIHQTRDQILSHRKIFEDEKWQLMEDSTEETLHYMKGNMNCMTSYVNKGNGIFEFTAIFTKSK